MSDELVRMTSSPATEASLSEKLDSIAQVVIELNRRGASTKTANQIDQIASQMGEMRDLLSDSLARQAVTEVKLTAMDVIVHRLHSEVFTGDGHPSIITRLQSIEEKRHGDRGQLQTVGFKVDELIREVEALRYGGTEPTKEMNRKFEKYVEDQTAHRRANNAMTIGLIVSALAAVIGAVATIMAK